MPILIFQFQKLVCHICSMALINKHSLKVHMKKHEEGKHQCKFCGKKFRWNSSLNSHMKSAHPEHGGGVVYPCTVCGKVFNVSFLSV